MNGVNNFEIYTKINSQNRSQRLLQSFQNKKLKNELCIKNTHSIGNHSVHRLLTSGISLGVSERRSTPGWRTGRPPIEALRTTLTRDMIAERFRRLSLNNAFQASGNTSYHFS